MSMIACTNSPIVEAIVDIQVDLPSDFDYRKLEKCHSGIKSRYPEKKEKTLARGQFSFGREVSSAVSSRSVGYVFESSDKKKLFQARVDGFTFNHMAPYPHWSAFISEAKELWDIYRKNAKYRGLKRLAVRYINRFDINEPKIRIDDYFRVGPSVPNELPQDLDGFHFIVAFSLADGLGKVTITQAVVESSRPGQVSILLDVDLFQTESFPPGSELWTVFDRMRIQKNEIFDACLTEKAKELIR